MHNFIVTDLITGEVLEELPLITTAYTKGVNTVGGFRVSSPRFSTEGNAITKDLIKPGARELWILRDGAVQYGGIIWAVSTAGGPQIEIAGMNHLSYFERRNVNRTFSWVDRDQYSIVREVFTYAQGIANGSINLDVTTDASDVRRTHSVDGSQHRTVLETVDELAGAIDGFDYVLEYGGSIQDGFTKKLELYERVGSRTEGVLDTSKNVVLKSYTQDASEMANEVSMEGAGEGSERIQATVGNTTREGVPLLQRRVSDKQLQDFQLVYSHADSALRYGLDPLITVEVQAVVEDDVDSEVGSYQAGDDVRLIVDDGFIQVDDRFRIMSYDVVIENTGKETVNMTLTQLESTV